MKRPGVHLLAAARLIIAAAAVPAHAAPAPDGAIAAQVDALLSAAVSGGFGGAVVIEREGRVLLAKGYGFANRRTQTPFTPDTVAPIGSITKTFTAHALVQLADDAKVDLQDPVRAYLPTTAEPAASARLDRILVHQAGLAEYCGEDFERRTRAELVADCAQRPLAARPGSFAYSNLGYSILAAIVEEVAGQAWQDYLQAHIFGPAGMTRSGWMFADRADLEFAEGYLDGQPQGMDADRIASLRGEVWNLKGNGGLQASASDMHRYYRFLLQQPHSIRELMTTPHADQSEGVKSGYGLVIRVDRSGRPYRIGHSGSDGVFLSYFMWLPQQRTFMYFVGNNGELAVHPVLVAVLDALQDGVGAKP